MVKAIAFDCFTVSIEKFGHLFSPSDLGPQCQSTIPPCGGQSCMALPVKIASGFGVLEFSSLTPDTRHLKP
jgi:hypothetical protein